MCQKPFTKFRSFVAVRCLIVGCLSLASNWCASANAQDRSVEALGKLLSFHASFDHGPDADFARGDRSIWTATSMNKRAEATKGLPSGGEVKLDANSGRFGSALRFGKSAGPIVFFKAENNLTLPNPGWSGTVSFWLNTDPANELKEGFCDPIQITSKQWDDAAMFVEFEKRAAGIPFRLGVYADKSVWNPTNRNFADIPAAERPLATVNNPPFAAGKWTHVAVVFEKFNTGKNDGLATLYLDGKKVGEISARQQTFTWDQKQADLMLGLSYIGMMDDLSVFDGALTQKEIGLVFGLKNGVAELHAKTK